MPWRVQLRAKYGKGTETEFARIFNGLPDLGQGVALVEKDTEIVLTFIAESEKDLDTMKRVGALYEKQGLKIEIEIRDLGK
jgi:hypothetical protein